MMSGTIWNELAESAAGNGPERGILRRLIHPDCVCEMYAVVEKPSLNRMFMIFVGERHEIRTRLPALRGLSLDYETWHAEGSDRTVLVLRVRNEAQNDLFVTLATDLGDYVAGARTEDEVTTRLLARLSSWERFLQRRGDEGLSPDACRGLFGELWVLQRLIQGCNTANTDSLIQGWVGPTEAPQDFLLERCRIEVKTTAAKQEQRMRISSERQLDWTIGPRLFLAQVSVAEAPSEGISLPGIVALIRDALSGREGADVFETALLRAGYSDQDQRLYSQPAYTARECNVFEVREGFPCIVERSVPPGVGELTYSVGVGSCTPFAVPWTAIVDCIEEARAC